MDGSPVDAGDPEADALAWRFERARARIEPTVEAVVVEHAKLCWGLPVRSREADAPDGERRLVWTIDKETVLELRFPERGPAELVVHDFGLHEPLTKALRTRHVRIRHATGRELDAGAR